MRTIRAPGIQINEIDRSQYDANSEVFQNTTTLVMGFADKGDDYDPKYIFSLNDFVNTYGTPQSEAERYFYLAAEEIFRQGGLMIGGKLPYDNDARNKYTYERYVVSDTSAMLSPYDAIIATGRSTSEIDQSKKDGSLSAMFTFGEDKFVSLLSDAVSSEFEITKAFYSFLNNNCNFGDEFGNTLSNTVEQLFNQPLAFYNLSVIFQNNQSIVDNLKPKAPIRKKTALSSEYLTRGALYSIIEDQIPVPGSLSTVNQAISSYVDFANSFNGLVSSSRSVSLEANEDEENVMTGFLRSYHANTSVVYDDGVNAISSKNDFRDTQLSLIAEKLVYGGFYSYEGTISAFFNSITMPEVEQYYNNISSQILSAPFNCLSDCVPVLSAVSADFNAEFTGIPMSFNNVKNYRSLSALTRNNSPDSNYSYSGLMDIEQLDALKVGYAKVPENQFVIVDITRGQYGRDELLTESPKDHLTNQYLGILPVVTTAANAMFMQNMLPTSEIYDSYNPLDLVLDVVKNGEDRLENDAKLADRFFIPLYSADPNIETVGQIATNYFPSLSYLDEKKINTQYLKQIGIVVFKVISETSTNKISFTPVESFVGSFDRTDVDQITKASVFIDDVVNNNSEYINVFSNVKPNNACDIYTISKQTPVSLGFYESQTKKDISYSVSINEGMNAILAKLEDTNRIPIDIVLDAGVSNIAQFVATSQPNGKGDYTPDLSLNGFKKVNPKTTTYWKLVLKKLDNFCSNTRRDCMFVADGPRQLVLDGNFPVVRKTNLFKSVKTEILPYIKYLTGLNTSYGAGYVNWFKVYDSSRQVFMWCPPSIKAGGVYLYCDIVANPWDAPAGISRGTIGTAYDVSFNPTNDEAGTIYDANWNYAISYPLNGIVMEGQKTFQRNKTAFDRVNVRRLFLSMERGVWLIARQYLYEGITTTRLNSCRDSVTEFLNKIKLNGGLNDFYVICDTRNNTAETIDNNEMHLSVAAKPVKSAEFILMNFICTTQSANVEEVALEHLT